MRKDGKVRGGACGAPPASIPLPTVAVVALLPQWLVGRGQAGARLCGGEWMGTSSRDGERVGGGRRGPFYSGLDMRGCEETPTGFQSHVESKLNGFPFEIKFSIAMDYSST
jgi:hypothetical protein